MRDKFGISFEQAEQAKQNIGRSALAAQLVDAIKPALHEMVAELKTNLGYCRRMGVSTEFDRVYAVGGCHGCAQILGALHAAILEDSAAADARAPAPAGRRVAVYLGDYIDRGPESSGLLEMLIGAPLPGF